MIRINDIIDKVIENNPDADVDIIDRAYIFSARVHDGQVRLSGEPYLSHPLEVAGILADMKLDSVSVAAGLLHDVIEDTHAAPDEIEDIFGKNVLHIVSGVTKLSKLNYNNAQHRQAESIRKMLLAMADDISILMFIFVFFMAKLFYNACVARFGMITNFLSLSPINITCCPNLER